MPHSTTLPNSVWTTLCAGVLLAAIGGSACTESLSFPDWTLPIPADTRVIEYAPVPADERTERLELAGDVVVPDTAFYRTSGMVVDELDRIYVLDSGNGQVVALEPDGEVRFVLGREGQGPAPPFPDEAKEAFLARFAEDYPGLSASQFDWPDRLPALEHLRVDGHGHLFVFPFDYDSLDAPEIPVDVYDRDGERLFSGTMARTDSDWNAAQGEFVYWLHVDRDTEQATLARRRIVEPFE